MFRIRALWTKESDVTEGELNDLINVAVQRTKEKYSSLTEGELREIINDAVQKTKEKYSGITAGQSTTWSTAALML